MPVPAIEKFNEAVEAYKSAKKLAAEGAKPAFKEGVAELFSQNPSIEAVRWRQYTPYWNDGDTCVFSVDDPYIRLEGTDEEAGDYEDGFDTRAGVLRYSDDTKEKALGEAIEKFFGQFPDEIMEEIFGDHRVITVYRDGRLEEDDYEHD